MRKLMFGGLMLFVFACNSNKKQPSALPPNLYVLNYDTALKLTDNGYTYYGKPFSGYMIEQEKDGRIVYKLPVINGKQNGVALGWYNTGEKLMQRLYQNGKIEGLFTQWWPNGNCRYLFNYKQGQFDGSLSVFFSNGSQRQKSNYHAGKEEGLQQTWDSAGKLISNYTIKNNNLYGVISVKSCIPSAIH